MTKIGVTGNKGFIGKHLLNELTFLKEYEIIEFDSSFFKNKPRLDSFVRDCDIIVHLAAVNRNSNHDVLYETNVNLIKELIRSLDDTQAKPHIIFTSSIQEASESIYGRSKKVGRELLAEWATRNNASFTGLIVPNVFGPFGKPYYNSVISTFSHQLTHNEAPHIDNDGTLNLIFIQELIKEIISVINEKNCCKNHIIKHTSVYKVSEILEILTRFKNEYFDNGIIPVLNNEFEINLFNTFRSHIDHKTFFPFPLKVNSDNRGVFIELSKLKAGGQVSFSTTKPGITRGNHFHTRKIERFIVISGHAKIEMRMINTKNILSFEIIGENPSFVDMPVWYTHNITNIGNTDLFTIFWINEFYDERNPDTFYEIV